MERQVGRGLGRNSTKKGPALKTTNCGFQSDPAYLLGPHQKFQKQHLFEEANSGCSSSSVFSVARRKCTGVEQLKITELVDL